MELTKVKHKIISPSAIQLKGMMAADIRGLYSLFKKEGCIESENKFTDEEKAISLDDIQTRLAQKNKTDKQASADMFLCIDKNKYLLIDAKFKSKSIKNIDPKELSKKLTGSMSLVSSDDFYFGKAFYVLFKSQVITPSQQNRLKREFQNKPQFRFMNALQFRELFER